MKTTTLKVVSMILVLAAAGACGKRTVNGINITKAGPGTGASDYDALAYNETPTASGNHQYIIAGTSTAPLVYLKQENTDTRIYFVMTLALRKAGKNLKTNEYRLIYNEYLTCNDGPSNQNNSNGKKGTLQYQVTHQTMNNTWTVANHVVTLAGLGTFQRDPAPKPKQPRPLTGKITITAGLISEPEILKNGPWATDMAQYTGDYSKLDSDTSSVIALADAIKKIGTSCQGVKATSVDAIPTTIKSDATTSASALADTTTTDSD